MPTRSEVELMIASGDDVQGFVRVSPALIDIPEHRYCFFVITTSREDFRAGDYALVDIDAEVKDGDLVITSDWCGSNNVMRLVQTEQGWTIAPLKRSSLKPWFVDKLDELIIGKIVKTFSVNSKEKESRLCQQENT